MFVSYDNDRILGVFFFFNNLLRKIEGFFLSYEICG